MNADFEAELEHYAFAPGRPYRRPASFDALNRRLSEKFLWLARDGDALLAEEPWSDSLIKEARTRGVELISPARVEQRQSHRLFTPWGWTPSAKRAGEGVGASVEPLPFETVARVNSKLWSHALEVELGISIEVAATASNLDELSEAARSACPRANDKWVVKSPYGFAARERVLGRGPVVEGAQAAWASKRLARGETLIFQPWLEVVREAVEDVRFGSVQIVIHEGRVTQVDATRRMRLTEPATV